VLDFKFPLQVREREREREKEKVCSSSWHYRYERRLFCLRATGQKDWERLFGFNFALQVRERGTDYLVKVCATGKSETDLFLVKVCATGKSETDRWIRCFHYW